MDHALEATEELQRGRPTKDSENMSDSDIIKRRDKVAQSLGVGKTWLSEATEEVLPPGKKCSDSEQNSDSMWI